MVHTVGQIQMELINGVQIVDFNNKNFISSTSFSASGCPIANRNKMRVLESGGTLEQHKAAVVSATSLKFDSVNCPTPGKYFFNISLLLLVK